MLTTGWNGYKEVGDTETYIATSPYSSPTSSLTRCRPPTRPIQSMHPLAKATGSVLKKGNNDNRTSTDYHYFPVVCGGDRNYAFSNKCYHLNAAPPHVATLVGIMQEMRIGAASIPILNGTALWVTGGEYDLISSTTEWLNVSAADVKMEDASSSSSSPLPKVLSAGIQLPQPRAFHCLKVINAKTAILYGGSDGSPTDFPGSNLTWTIHDIDANEQILSSSQGSDNLWIPRASMKLRRFLHGCGVIRQDIFDDVSSVRKLFVVAAGGAETRYETTDLVELLAVTVTEGEDNVVFSEAWEEGPRMPTTLRDAASATTPDQTMLILAGGLITKQPYKMSYKIFNLRCAAAGYCWWTTDENRLMFPRTFSVAMVLPPTGNVQHQDTTVDIDPQCKLLPSDFRFLMDVIAISIVFFFFLPTFGQTFAR